MPKGICGDYGGYMYMDGALVPSQVFCTYYRGNLKNLGNQVQEINYKRPLKIKDPVTDPITGVLLSQTNGDWRKGTTIPPEVESITIDPQLGIILSTTTVGLPVGNGSSHTTNLVPNGQNSVQVAIDPKNGNTTETVTTTLQSSLQSPIKLLKGVPISMFGD